MRACWRSARIWMLWMKLRGKYLCTIVYNWTSIFVIFTLNTFSEHYWVFTQKQLTCFGSEYKINPSQVLCVYGVWADRWGVVLAAGMRWSWGLCQVGLEGGRFFQRCSDCLAAPFGEKILLLRTSRPFLSCVVDLGLRLDPTDYCCYLLCPILVCVLSDVNHMV